jgi:hypothetical protein
MFSQPAVVVVVVFVIIIIIIIIILVKLFCAHHESIFADGQLQAPTILPRWKYLRLPLSRKGVGRRASWYAFQKRNNPLCLPIIE